MTLTLAGGSWLVDSMPDKICINAPLRLKNAEKMAFSKAVSDQSAFNTISYRIDNQKTARKIKKKKLSCLRNKKNTIFAAVMTRGVAQLASALAWGARGRKFESSHPDESNRKTDVMKVTSVFFCEQ